MKTLVNSGVESFDGGTYYNFEISSGDKPIRSEMSEIE